MYALIALDKLHPPLCLEQSGTATIKDRLHPSLPYGQLLHLLGFAGMVETYANDAGCNLLHNAWIDTGIGVNCLGPSGLVCFRLVSWKQYCNES